MGRTFDDLLAEAWASLIPLRQATNDEPLIEWWKLSELTSSNDILCGFTMHAQGFFRKKSIAEIHLAYDHHGAYYKISTWRKYHHPVVVFPSTEGGVHPNLDQAISKLEEMIVIIRPLVAEGKVKTSFPPDWVGKRLFMML